MARKRKRSDSTAWRQPWWSSYREPVHIDAYDGKPHVTELPAELLESIGDYLDLTNLCAARATCKTFYKTFLGPFVDAFLTAKYFRHLDRGSMQLLCNISAKREFARHVRSIRLWADTVDPGLHEQPFPQTNPQDRAADNPSPLTSYDLSRLYPSNANEPCDDEAFLKEELPGMLETIFANFQDHGISIGIKFNTPPFSLPNYWACRCNARLPSSMTGHYDLRPCNLAAHRPIWNAKIKTRYPAAGIDTAEGYIHSRPDLSWFSAITPSIVTTNLRSLSLILASSYCYPSCDQNWTVYCRRREREISSFLIFLARAARIEQLSLGLTFRMAPQAVTYELLERCSIKEELFYATTTRSYLDGCTISLQEGCQLLPNLKSLDLFNHEIKLDTMTEFCRQRSGTLMKVSLEWIQYRYQNIPQAGAAIRSSVRQGNPVNEIDVTLQECYAPPGRGSNKGLSKSYDALIARGCRRSSRLANRASDSML